MTAPKKVQPVALVVTVTAKCIECGATREIKAGEVPSGEMPMCHECGNLMIATKAKAALK